MNELAILTTETDLYTHDISKMGDFFSLYIKNMKSQLELETIVDNINISPATISIIAEVLNLGALSKMGTQYVPNFDSLPIEIKEGIKTGKYILGESKQVTGELRPVLIDANTKVRVKDLTLKEVKIGPNNMDITRNLLTQMQLKQISDKLDCLYDMMNFQIRRDRDRDLLEPFFKARDYIRDAQVTNNEEDRNKYLDYAMDDLKKVAQAGYHELITCSKMLADKVRNPIFRQHKHIREYMIYMCEDIYMINKSVGLQMQIYDYLNKTEEARATLKEYTSSMVDLSQKPVGIHGESAIGLLQDNFLYRKDNKDMWFNFIKNIEELDKCSTGIGENSKTYLICAEG